MGHMHIFKVSVCAISVKMPELKAELGAAELDQAGFKAILVASLMQDKQLCPAREAQASAPPQPRRAICRGHGLHLVTPTELEKSSKSLEK